MKKKLPAALLAIAIGVCACHGLCACSGKGTHTPAASEYRTAMQFYDGFKILQLTDLHFGIETDVAAQLEIIIGYVRSTSPDLIILTGDSFMYTTKRLVKYLFKALNDECAALTARRGRLTKFSFTFGNHDNQGDYPRYFINEAISEYVTADGREVEDGRYAAFIDFENDGVFGLTNFVIDLVDDVAKPTDEVDVVYRLHVIDSNTYVFNGTDYDYDVIHADQLDHAESIYLSATADRDYIGLAFFHIPLHEYGEAYEQFLLFPEDRGQGEFLEEVLCGYTNNGAYEKLKNANVCAFFCGHNHKNYGDFLYTDKDGDTAILSYGVKANDQLYHDDGVMGYKTVTLRGGITREEFLSFSNLKSCFKNVTGGADNASN